MTITEFKYRLVTLQQCSIPFQEVPYLNALYIRLQQIDDEITDETLEEAKTLFEFLDAVMIRRYTNKILFGNHQLFLNNIMQEERKIVEQMSENISKQEIINTFITQRNTRFPENRNEKIDFYAEWLILQNYGKIEEAREMIDQIVIKELGNKVSVRKVRKMRKYCLECYQASLENEILQKIPGKSYHKIK